MRTFHTTSLADQVFEKIENDIITGAYSRGEILTELKLAEDLGVSRTPIREAIRRLEVEDFPVIVIIDSEGNNLYETGRAAYLAQNK